MTRSDNEDVKFKKEWRQRDLNNKQYKKERPISKLYPVIDTDLARDNIENDLTASDMQDL